MADATNPQTLEEIVDQHPYTDFLPWWSMGERFLLFMSSAICTEWHALGGVEKALDPVQAHLVHYICVVYADVPRDTLLNDFMEKRGLETIRSGEFDALSYAFYRAAFESIAEQGADDATSVERARRAFTERVGQRFYQQLRAHLELELPDSIASQRDFAMVCESLQRIGEFLQAQGYLRDHFAFSFEVDVAYGGHRLRQTPDEALAALLRGDTVYALYEMGYPAILPSAVYLYNTVGEAQHHSSRTIQDHFATMGYTAHETDDFDPTGFASDRVVELWDIRPSNP